LIVHMIYDFYKKKMTFMHRYSNIFLHDARAP